MPPAIPVKLLEGGFRSEVLKLLVAEGAIGERLSASLLAWRHSGFSFITACARTGAIYAAEGDMIDWKKVWGGFREIYGPAL